MREQEKGLSLFLSRFALVVLATLVFGWGLHAKLDLYHTGSYKLSTTNSMAKLSAESRKVQPAASSRRQLKRQVVSAVPTAALFPFGRVPAETGTAHLLLHEDAQPDRPSIQLRSNQMRRPPPQVAS